MLSMSCRAKTSCTYLISRLLAIGLASIMALQTRQSRGRAEEPAESWHVQGRVVDEQGAPVDDFVAATFWSANGKLWDEAGEYIKVDSDAELTKLWKEEGVLAASPRFTAERLGDGRFTLAVEQKERTAVFVTDAQQRKGGVVRVERDQADQPIAVTLAPLVRVTGKVYCPEARKTPGWTMAYVHAAGSRKHGLIFTQCASFQARFSFLLPPGTYDFDVYSNQPDAHMPKPIERKTRDAPDDMPRWLAGIRVAVPPGRAELDLGTLDVVPDDSETLDRWADYYGKHPPELSITDARGIAKDVKWADLRGRWVLLEFWGPGCEPCIKQSLPKLVKLFDEHAQDRDRFLILAICHNWASEMTTMEQFDALAAPIVAEQWGGRALPFPVLIDGDGKTYDDYGVGSIPRTLLVDPDGNLVRGGNEDVLVEKLKAPRP